MVCHYCGTGRRTSLAATAVAQAHAHSAPLVRGHHPPTPRARLSRELGCISRGARPPIDVQPLHVPRNASLPRVATAVAHDHAGRWWLHCCGAARAASLGVAKSFRNMLSLPPNGSARRRRHPCATAVARGATPPGGKALTASTDIPILQHCWGPGQPVPLLWLRPERATVVVRSHAQMRGC